MRTKCLHYDVFPKYRQGFPINATCHSLMVWLTWSSIGTVRFIKTKFKKHSQRDIYQNSYSHRTEHIFRNLFWTWIQELQCTYIQCFGNKRHVKLQPKKKIIWLTFTRKIGCWYLVPMTKGKLSFFNIFVSTIHCLNWNYFGIFLQLKNFHSYGEFVIKKAIIKLLVAKKK